IEMLHVLELGARGREQLLRDLDMPIHRAADVEEQQHLDGVVPLGPHVDVEIALVRRAFDGAVEIELLRRPGARELAQAAQGDLDVAGAKLDFIIEILELALVPNLYCAEIAVAVLADAYALRIVSVRAKRRRASRAYPFRTALMAALLFRQSLAQGF